MIKLSFQMKKFESQNGGIFTYLTIHLSLSYSVIICIVITINYTIIDYLHSFVASKQRQSLIPLKKD